MDSNPMVSSLLNKLANYTNLSQGVVEHEEDEDSRRREIKVPMLPCVDSSLETFWSENTLARFPQHTYPPPSFFIFRVLCLSGYFQCPVLLGDPQTWVRRNKVLAVLCRLPCPL